MLRRRTSTAAGLASAALLMPLSGCGEEPAEPTGPTVEQRITRDFGRVLLAEDEVPIDENPTALRALRSRHRVGLLSTVYVESIDGNRQKPQGDRGTLWVLNINGIETDGWPRDLRLHQGDVVQWDLRDWYVRYDVRATVGAFPRPFAGGMFGKRFPTTVRCARPRQQSCHDVTQALRDAGAQMGRPARTSPRPEIHRARVYVGTWQRLRRKRWAPWLDYGPAYSGVFARFTRDAKRLHLLDWDGHGSRAVGAGAGLVAAMRPTEATLAWVVTGVDDEGVKRAARALTAKTLRDSFALAVTARGPERLPLPPSP